jgi:hypothetical protein
MWVVRFTPQPIYFRTKSSCIYSWSPFRDSTDAPLQCNSDASPASAVRSHPTSNVICEMTVNRCSLFWAVRSLCLELFADVSGELIGPIFKGHAVQRWEQVAEGLSRAWCELRNKPEDRRPHPHGGECLTSRMNIKNLKPNYPNYLRTWSLQFQVRPHNRLPWDVTGLSKTLINSLHRQVSVYSAHSANSSV